MHVCCHLPHLLAAQTLFGPHCTAVGELSDGVDVSRLVTAAAQKSLPFDAVFLDWMMPIVDGPSAAKALKTAGYRGQIVGMSATQTAAKDPFAAVGVEMVLGKPVSQADLMRIVASKLFIFSHSLVQCSYNNILLLNA